ncbi:PREDICTED: uncharacterized protein LOC105449500 [Wasmannia auropunctata]|uniref:uncharacterized protein LOC105449500 n=1 Tax=Wasmannia auropunctata TaxID=64793 RepID=UPI0005EFB6B6|nr:PREDICTED: uncharacterized protein LOC105449500 [Wasmannia auropunctata]
MNRSLNHVLSTIERKILESIRLIENEEFSAALQIISESNSNLQRIRNVISDDTFNTLKNNCDRLQQICDNNLVQSIMSNRSRSYVAPRLNNLNRGRPKVQISKEQLQFLIQENYIAKEMARHFSCSINLVYKKCYSFGIKIRNKYYNGSDAELRREISDLHAQYPNSGSNMITAYLKAKGKVVQRRKVRRFLSEIDPIGTASRWSNAIHRRTYKVPTPNSLWHIDANLKLIRWRFAIHGCIDGYSRLILYLKCTTSMTASTVIPFFANAAVQYGLPSRVRSDFGYENLFVAMVMNAIRGLNRGSHLTGRSVHNQRIERLWVDVFKEVIDFFYTEFTALEEDRLLDINNEKHVFALQQVYLTYINEKLDVFTQAWNFHKLRTERNKTPRQLWLSGMIKNVNSEHTATREIFQDQPHLYNRIIDAFGIDELNFAIITRDEESNSNLTVQLELSEDRMNYIINVLADASTDYKTKYLQIVAYLNNINYI